MVVFRTIFIVSVLSAMVYAQQPPLTIQSVYAVVGSDAILNLTTSMTFGALQIYKYNPKKLLIDIKTMSNNGTPNKYQFSGNMGNYTFRVKAVDRSDGRGYYARSDIADDINFNIIVIDLWPPSLFSNNNNFSVGNMITANCTLHWYGSDHDDLIYSAPLMTEQFPVLGMMLGSNIYNGPGIKTFPESQDLYHHIYSMETNKTIMNDWAGKNMVCIVSSSLLQTNINSSIIIPIPFPTHNVSIWNNITGVLYNNLGDIVNCTANGYPLPTVTWTLVSPLLPGCIHKSSGGYNSYAELKFECRGTQTWNCSAKNMVNGMEKGVWRQDTFYVEYDSNLNNTLPSTDNSNAVGLGVGLGIGLGVPLLIGLITLCCCLMKRRKAQGTLKKKQPTNGQQKKVTAPTVTASIPPNKTSNVKVNLNPNPTFPVPVFEEQKATISVNPGTVRGSAGMADIGVRTVSKSGSLSSQLNESQDSSDHGSAAFRLPAKNSSVV